MTKQDVINQVSRKTGLDPFTSRSIIESFFEVVRSAVAQGDTITIRTFGRFGSKHRAAKVARNIKKNTAITIKAHTVPAFKPSPEFVDQVRLSGAETNLGH
jgi:DNA-binding protein HU-beta